MNNEAKLQKLEKILDIVDKDYVTHEDLSQVIDLLTKTLSKANKELQDKTTLIQDELKSLQLETSDTIRLVNSSLREQIQNIYDSIRNIELQKGDQGEKGDMGEIGPAGEDGKPGKDGKDGKDGSPDTGEEIIGKINEVSKDGPQIDASHIKNLPQATERIIKAVGGGNIEVLSNGQKIGSGQAINFIGASVTHDGHRANVTVTGGGSTSPGGPTNSIQYNNGSFGGSANATLDGSGNAYFAGNVGIGTTNPVSILDIASTQAEISLHRLTDTSSNSGIALFTTGTLDWYLGYTGGDTNKNFRIYDGATGLDAITIQRSTGNVGIGTTNPLSKLDVNGTAHFHGGMTYFGNGTFINLSSEGSYMLASAAASNAGFTANRDDLGYYASFDLLENHSGATGWSIQMAPYDSNLSIVDRANSQTRIYINAGGTVDIDGGLSIGNGVLPGDNVITLNTSDGSAGFANGATVITNDGSVGVGTSSPGDRIHLYGVPSGARSNASIRLETGGGTSGGYAYTGFDFYNEGGQTGGMVATGASYSPVGNFGANDVILQSWRAGGLQNKLVIANRGNDAGTAGPIIFNQGGYQTAYERMRIHSNGNVGVGTSNPYWKFTVGDGISPSVDNGIVALFANNVAISNTSNSKTLFLNATDSPLSGMELGSYQYSINSWQPLTLSASTIVLGDPSRITASVGINTASPNARLDIISTSNLFRAGYDTSNYFKADVSSTGAVTFDAVGSGASFTFSDPVTLGTSGVFTTGTIELGHASDTTLSRSSAGVLAVEGVVIPTVSSTNTFTNKRRTPRVYQTTSTSTLTPEIDTYDCFELTAQAASLTIANHSTSTPTNFEEINIRILDNGTARAITYGTNYVDGTNVTRPTTTVISTTLNLKFRWDSSKSKYVLLAKD